MTTVGTVLMVLGAGIFLFLGFAHTVFTFQSSPTSGPMTPTDPELQQALTRPGGIGMAPHLQSTLWSSWVGFNLSHSLGIIVTASIVLAEVLTDVEQAMATPWFVVVVTVVPAAYLVISIRHWFRDPTVGIGVGTALLWIGTIVHLAF
jgi:hypothetical protein